MSRNTVLTAARAAAEIIDKDRSELRSAIKMLADKRPATTKKDGFSTLGENLIAIAKAEQGIDTDRRLVRAPAGGSVGDPTGGGFLVQEDFAAGLVGLAYEEAVIAPLCDRRTTAGQMTDIKLPGIDETSRADGSRWGGGLAYWSAEGATVSPSVPRFKQLAFSGKKLIALVWGTNELLADAPLFESHVNRVFSAEMGFKLDDAVLSGTGAGVPHGILSSPALITVAKSAGQATSTITADNITGMWRRLPAPSRRRAVWLVHEDVEQQLDTLSGAGGLVPGMFLPAGINGNPYPLLKGRPLVAVEQAPPLGSAGDIVLADLDHYVIIDGGIKPALSAHVHFDTDQVLWRFVLRVDGQSAFASPITPYKGSTTRSPFVALAAR